MSLTTPARNEAMNAIVIDSMSLHFGYPGLTGANELSGSGYVRQSCAFGAASSGVRSLSAVTNFTVGAGHNVLWCGLWAGTVFKGYSPNSGSPKEFQLSGVSFYCPAHGYPNGQTVVFYGGTVPGGLTEGVVYFVVNSSVDAFQVAATSGGVPIAISSQPNPDCVVSRITMDSYFGANTHSINSWSIGAVF